MAKRHRIPPELTSRTKRLRREATFPERLLWARLRQNCDGLKFRRQHAVGPFIVDFYCAAKLFVVEVDGLSHDGRGDYDAKREAYLRSQGLRVMRVTNDDILQDLEAVAEGILLEVSKHDTPTAKPR